MSGQIPLLPREGERVGAGVILGPISTGGFAVVYETLIEALELHRAVKVMHPDADNETRERMLTEARILSKLIHQNIIHVHNYGETAAGLPFLEMDFVNGVTLEALIKKHGSLPLPVALAITAAALEALHYVHNISYTLNEARHSGVVHRDIKPMNIMVAAESGCVKLMDFGIARPMEMSIHTVPGTAPGTLNYMAPETYADGNSDTRSDIYQIGLLLYECVCGRAAFPQTNRVALNDAKTANTYRPINTYNRSDMIEAAAIIDKCLRLAPDERYQTAQECLADVRALYSALCPGAAPEQVIKSFLDGAPIPQNRLKRNYAKPLRRAALAASVVIAGGGGGIAAIHYSPQLLRGAARVYARLQAAASAQERETLTMAATAQKQSAGDIGTEYMGLRQNEQVQPPQTRKAGVPEQTRQAAPSASARQAAEKAEAADANVGDSALAIISHADDLFADKKYQEALSAYQKAIKTPSAARQEAIRKSLYGAAKCNAALFQAGQTPRSNYLAAWRSVANAYPPDSPQHVEAQLLIGEEAAR